MRGEVTIDERPKTCEPTQKQLDFIAAIQDAVGVEFAGTTKQEASAYIDANIGRFNDIRNIERDLDGAVMESLHGDWGCRDD